jgi:hypothetical protein
MSSWRRWRPGRVRCGKGNDGMKAFMRTRHLFFLSVVLGTVVLTVAIQDRGSVRRYPARPIFGAVMTLDDEYGHFITYEDPPYAYEGDLGEASMKVRQALDQLMLGPPVDGSQDVGPVLNRLIQLSRDQGGHFRVLQTGDVFHVVPTEVRDADGRWVSHPSILDTPISIPTADRAYHEMIEAICQAVGAAARVKVVGIGGVGGEGIHTIADPPPRFSLGAEQESARTVLMRTLAVAAPGRWTWFLLYDFDDRMYYLNISPVPDRTPKPPIPISPNPSLSLGGLLIGGQLSIGMVLMRRSGSFGRRVMPVTLTPPVLGSPRAARALGGPAGQFDDSPEWPCLASDVATRDAQFGYDACRTRSSEIPSRWT